MIQLIEAPPRSGKSYFAVNYLCKFAKYDALYNEYVLNPEVLIISNIEGLKIKHWKFPECMKDKSIEEFFTVENFEAIQEKTKKRHIIICLDECHDFFPKGYYNKEVYSFFAFHGHLGLDVILMTQGILAMSRMFNPLLEYVVKVRPRTKAIAPGAISYSYHDLQGKYLYSKVLKKDKLVFNAYKSFRQDEQNKPKSAVLIWAAMIVCVLSLGGFIFKAAIDGTKQKAAESARQAKKNEEKKAGMTLARLEAKGKSDLVDQVENHQAQPVGGDPAGDPAPEVHRYPVQGVMETSSGKILLIHGRRVGMDRVRHFDHETMQAEVIGWQIPEERVNRGSGGDLLAAAPRVQRAEPLGEAGQGFTPDGQLGAGEKREKVIVLKDAPWREKGG